MGGFVHFDSDRQEGLHAHIVIPQGVAAEEPCIVLPNADQICVACYFRPEKYTCDEVREYYDRLILHLVEGLGIKGYQTHNFDGLLKLQRSYKLTHVFIAQAEYEENRKYYEELADTYRVVVIAEREYSLSRESKLLVIHKPFSALSVVNLLRGEIEENGFEEAQVGGRKPFSCKGVRVLAVDDEEMNLVVAKGVLGSYGIEVDTCLSGREAVGWCTDIAYDVVFLDHMMPGFDGVETLRRIREINNGMYKDLPVVALTANTISGAREMFRNEGFTEFIPKPIERSTLERVLRKVLPKHCIQYGTESEDKNNRAEDIEPAGGSGLTEAEIQDEETGQAAVPQEAEAAVQDNRTGQVAGPQETEAGGDVAETAGSPDESAIPYDRLARAGINTEMGLAYCGGEEEFYLEMLRMFDTQSAGKKEEINSLYESANWADYAVKVHALKSTSLTIGAEDLSAYAKTLELAGKSGDVEYIRENHLTLLQMYEKVCESISGL